MVDAVAWAGEADRRDGPDRSAPDRTDLRRTVSHCRSLARIYFYIQSQQTVAFGSRVSFVSRCDGRTTTLHFFDDIEIFTEPFYPPTKHHPNVWNLFIKLQSNGKVFLLILCVY